MPASITSHFAATLSLILQRIHGLTLDVLRRDRGVVLLLALATLAALSARLRADVLIADAMESGSVVVLDADEVREVLSQEGSIDPTLFLERAARPSNGCLSATRQ